MTFRRILFSLAVLAAGVLIGLPLASLWQTDAPRSTPAPETVTQPTPALAEPVVLGEREPETPLSQADLEAIGRINDVTRTAVQRSLKSVAFVQVAETTTLPSDGFHDDLPGTYDRTVTGSGIVISEDGYVLTNAHVAAEGGRAEVRLTDRRAYEAELVGADPTTDVAVLQMVGLAEDDETPLPVAALGDSDELQVGDMVLAIGNPFRMGSTVTSGIISALGRQVNVIQNDFRVESFIQTDAAINQGNSGGALVNLEGEVIGMVTAIATESGTNEGYGFAVPVNLARRVAEDLIRYGAVRRGFLGVEVREVTIADARELGLSRPDGVLVDRVAPEGAGDRAGLRPGDILLEVEGTPIDATNTFVSRLAFLRPGDDVNLRIWRDDHEHTLSATLIGTESDAFREWVAGRTGAPPPGHGGATSPRSNGEVPTNIPRSEAADWGVHFRDLTPRERRLYQVNGGAFVESIRPESGADYDGLPTEVVVTEIEGAPVTSAEEARAALAALAGRARPALLRVRRANGRTSFYDLASPSLALN